MCSRAWLVPAIRVAARTPLSPVIAWSTTQPQAFFSVVVYSHQTAVADDIGKDYYETARVLIRAIPLSESPRSAASSLIVRRERSNEIL
jgi:hypothetical protein